MNDEAKCPKLLPSQQQIERMLSRSQTKVIFPIITLGLLTRFMQDGQEVFADKEIRASYSDAVNHLKTYLGHTLHIGGRYYDAYPSRNLPKYGVLKVVSNGRYQLLEPFTTDAKLLVSWIPERLNEFIDSRLSVVPRLSSREYRVAISDDLAQFNRLLTENIDKGPAIFEIFSFAIIKVHLEKFACKVYRDTRTSAHDSGVDIATNFGTVFQIKKLTVHHQKAAEAIYSELRANFDSARLDDGKVVLVIDDISKEVKSFLITMRIQTIDKIELLNLAQQFNDPEDREKVLRIVHEEFRREYASVV